MSIEAIYNLFGRVQSINHQFSVFFFPMTPLVEGESRPTHWGLWKVFVAFQQCVKTNQNDTIETQLSIARKSPRASSGISSPVIHAMSLPLAAVKHAEAEG